MYIYIYCVYIYIHTHVEVARPLWPALPGKRPLRTRAGLWAAAPAKQRRRPDNNSKYIDYNYNIYTYSNTYI